MRTDLWRQVEALLPQLWRLVRGYEANLALQEELLQEILLAIWESLPQLRDPQRLRAYVLRIGHNVAATHVTRAVRSRAEVSLDDKRACIELHDGSHDSSSEALHLLEAVRALPLPLRQVVSLQLEGMSYHEIAEVLGIDANNVGVRAHRARKRLQELLYEAR